jgi:two-component system chemotaxis sensor kinase CheA
MKDPYRYFRVEARELLDELSRGVLDLEAAPGDRAEIVARLLRAAHTLKGAAHVVARPDIGDLAHALEDDLAAARDTKAAPIEPLLARVDAIAALVGALAGPPAARAPGDAGSTGRGEDLLAARPGAEDVERLLAEVDELRARLGAIADGVERHVERAAARRVLEAELAAADAAIGRLDERAHALQLVPAEAAFVELERAARDAALALGKSASFHASGGDVRVDGRVLSAARDALLHVVRNAVDHGIEPPAERARAGKPPAGRIDLEVRARGHRVTFACRDDGRGVDLEAVRAAAVARGVVDPREPLDRETTERLVFAAGVSTHGSVDTMSGRGVGLDVVRATAARLGGDVGLRSEPGRGVEIALTLPVSLASMRVLVVRSGARRAAVPLDAVVRALRIGPADVLSTAEGATIAFGPAAIPLTDLEAWTSPGAPAAPARARTAVVLAVGDRLAALSVERLVRASRHVVRSVPAVAGTPALLGAAVDADGAPIPLLDPAAVLGAARAQGRPRAAAAPARTPLVLVIDDSLTTRMLVQSILEAAGLRAHGAASAEAGLQMARREHYDLFVVDVEMPGMDEFEFIARTREIAELRGVPSIVVSSRASDADRRRGVAVGARGYVAKGEFAQGRFLELVRGLVG